MAPSDSPQFLDEISGQPEALRNLVRFYRTDEGRRLLDRWRKLMFDSGRVVFAGMGTSEFAGDLIVPELAGAGIDATTCDAGEWLHYGRHFDGLPVLISQSGESAETRLLAEQIGPEGRVVAVTNSPDSALARHAALVLPLHAGPERSISTKTYVNTLALLYLAARNVLAPDSIDAALERLKSLSIEMLEHDTEMIEHAADLLAEKSTLHFIARGPATVCARQGALTFMEGTRTYCTAFTGGAFRHGPMELVDSTHRVVVFMPGGETFDRMFRLARELEAMGSSVVGISDQAVTRERFPVLHVADYGELLFPIACASVQALLLDALARRRGVTTGEFRHSQKVTATEG